MSQDELTQHIICTTLNEIRLNLENILYYFCVFIDDRESLRKYSVFHDIELIISF